MGFVERGGRGKRAADRRLLWAALALLFLALPAVCVTWQGQFARLHAGGGWQALLSGLGAAFAGPLFLGVRSAREGERDRQEHDLLRSLVDSASVGVAVVEGPDNRLQFANPVYQRILGGAAESAAGRPLRDVLPEEAAELAEGNIAEAYRTGGPVQAREVALEVGEPPHLSYWDVDYLPLRREEGRAPAMLMLAMPVSERVRARHEVEALAAQAQQRAAQLQAVLSAISDAVLVVDAGQNAIFVNDAAARYLGGEPTPEMLRRTGDLMREVELFWPDGAPMEAAERQLPRALRGEVIAGEEVMYQPPRGGPRRWARVSAAPVRDEGRITGAVVTASNITAQKEAQAERERLLAEVQAAGENLRTILDRMPDGVMVVDTAQRVVMSNGTTRRYVGQDVVGMTLPQLRDVYGFVMPDGRPFVPGQAPIDRALHGETVAGVEARILRLDGRIFDTLESAAPLYDSGGRISGAVVALTDITARKAAERDLQRLLAEVQSTREELQTALSQLPDIVVAFDRDLRVTLVSNAARDYLGRDPTGQPLANLEDSIVMETADGRPFPRSETPMRRALAGEVVTGVEMGLRLPNGRRITVLVSAAPLYGAGPSPTGPGVPTGAIVIATDITARIRAEAERERLLAEVQAARENLRTILDHLPDGVLATDATGRITLANEGARQSLGSDIVGRPLAEVVRRIRFETPDGEPVAEDQWPTQRAMRGEAVSGMQVRAVLPDGTILDLLASAVALKDGEDRIIGAVLTVTDITPQRQAQAERERLLAEVEEASRNLQTILRWLPAGVIAVGPDLRVAFTNEVIQQYLGRDLVGAAAFDVAREYGITTPDGQPFPMDGQNPLLRALRGEPLANLEALAHLPDGRRVNVLASIAPMRGPGGTITGAVIATLDVTAERQAQAERERLLAEVQRARESLFSIVDRLPDWIMVFDANLTVTLSNEALRRHTGGEVTGMTAAELRRAYELVAADGKPFPPGQSPSERALQGEVATNVEVALRMLDGSIAYALESAAPLYEPDGHLYGVVAVLTEITRRKRAEAERERLLAQVEEGRRELQTIIDQLPDAVLVFDSMGRVTLSNSVARAYAGRDMEGRPLANLYAQHRFRQSDGHPFPEGESPVERALRGESVMGVEASLTLPDGRSIDVLKSAAPVLGPNGEVRQVAAVMTDVTNLKNLDRAKDQFISVAAHELRTPLTALKGHAQILLRRAERAGWAEGDKRNLHTIDDQVNRLNELIGRLLNVSRIRLGRLELNRQPTDIVALVHQVAEELQVTTDRHRITVQAEVGELVGYWDPAALRQVLTNLVGNAIRYADPGPIDLRVRREDGRAVVSVTDHGPGIPPERQAQIFEAFRPGAAEERRKGGGLGLGLYISRGIVEAHGGQIWLESRVGVGSTFTFSLPLDGRG